MEGVFNKGRMYNSGFMMAMIFIFQVTEGVFNKGRMYNSGVCDSDDIYFSSYVGGI